MVFSKKRDTGGRMQSEKYGRETARLSMPYIFKLGSVAPGAEVDPVLASEALYILILLGVVDESTTFKSMLTTVLAVLNHERIGRYANGIRDAWRSYEVGKHHTVSVGHIYDHQDILAYEDCSSLNILKSYAAFMRKDNKVKDAEWLALVSLFDTLVETVGSGLIAMSYGIQLDSDKHPDIVY